MAFSTWFTFMLAAWGIALSPGNGALLCMSHGLNYGLRQTTATIFGLQLGLLLVLLISALGLGSLLLASEIAFTVVKWLGAAYLLWLGIQLWRSPVHLSQGIPIAAPLSARQRFLLGFLTNISNPKGIIFMVAVLPAFMNPHSSNRALEIAILATTMCVIDCLVMHFYAGLASKLAILFKTPLALRWQNRVFGGVLIAVALGVLLVKRQINTT